MKIIGCGPPCALCAVRVPRYCVLSLSPFSNSILCVAITAADLVSSYPIIIQNVGLVAADKHLHSTGQLWSELFIDCRSPPPLFISPHSVFDNFDIDVNVAYLQLRRLVLKYSHFGREVY